MSSSVAIAVITYRRPALLANLLASLQTQVLSEPARWSVRVVVVDNDADESAREIAENPTGPLPVHYAVEPDPGIPLARETSVRLCASDDAVIFVDDDEVAPSGWLDRLLTTWGRTGADVVTGPVEGILPDDAPAWARHSDVYTSVGNHATGAELDKAYTNNTLVSRRVLDTVTPAFDPAFRFTGSSDLHFFLRVHAAGFRIVWDDEAKVQEIVPPERVTRGWLVRRAFRSGAGDSISRRLITPGWKGTATSIALAGGRVVNGAGLLVLGVASPERRIKGLRRVVSGVGSFAGVLGVNHDEYKR